MKVIAISDLHGELIDIKDEFDLLLICGDVCPVECHGKKFQEEWINDEFVQWINSLNFKGDESKVIMIAGNHDFIFDNIVDIKLKEWLTKFNNRLVYLDNQQYNININNKEYKIYGCPYCKPFGNWAFMREDLESCYKDIPNDLDILITHDAPDINELGVIKQGRWAGENAGNSILAEKIKEVKPKYCFNGHIHSGTHNIVEYNGIKLANVSIMNEYYYPEHEPLIINIE